LISIWRIFQMQETWNTWKPLANIPKRLYLEELKDNYDGLTLSFRGEKENLDYLIVFFDSAISYRNHDEGDLLRTLNEVHEHDVWPFFKVENSHYLEWFNQENFDIHKNKAIVHYLFATPNDVIDVLSFDSPVLRWAPNI